MIIFLSLPVLHLISSFILLLSASILSSGDLSVCETGQEGEENQKENIQTSAKPNPPPLHQGNIITSNYKVIKSDQL